MPCTLYIRVYLCIPHRHMYISLIAHCYVFASARVLYLNRKWVTAQVTLNNLHTMQNVVFSIFVLLKNRYLTSIYIMSIAILVQEYKQLLDLMQSNILDTDIATHLRKFKDIQLMGTSE